MEIKTIFRRGFGLQMTQVVVISHCWFAEDAAKFQVISIVYILFN